MQRNSTSSHVATLARRCRHRNERALWILGAAAAGFIWLVCLLALAAVLWTLTDQTLNLTDGLSGQDAAAALLVVLLPVAVVFLGLVRRRKSRLSGVLISSEQFPGVDTYVRRTSAALGMSQPPQVVLVTGTAPMSDSHGGGHGTILLHHDLFEICRENGDYSTLRFALARELGRFAGGHHTRWHELISLATDAVPFVRGARRRIECYTADRWGALLEPDAAADFLALVAASKVLWSELSVEALLRQSQDDSLTDRIVMLNMDTPPASWRAIALADVLLAPALDPSVPASDQQLTFHTYTAGPPDVAELAQRHAGARGPARGVFRKPLAGGAG